MEGQPGEPGSSSENAQGGAGSDQADELLEEPVAVYTTSYSAPKGLEREPTPPTCLAPVPLALKAVAHRPDKAVVRNDAPVIAKLNGSVREGGTP